MARRTSVEVQAMKISIILSMILLLTSGFSAAMDTVESPKTCKLCGMNRSVFAQSRMLVAYTDGTATGVCSLHCAAVDLSQNSGKQVSSIKVADYITRELVDARTTYWVVGGNKAGV